MLYSVLKRSIISVCFCITYAPVAYGNELAQVNSPGPIFPRPPERRPIQKLPPLPDLLKEAPGPSPAVPSTPDEPVGEFVVQEFQFQGSTVLSADELGDLAEPYLDRPLSVSDLLQLQSEITNHYVEQGYVTSGAVIPAEQDFSQGSVTIVILEGVLDEIEVVGNKRLKPWYIRDRVKLGAQFPLNINQLSDALRKLQLNPLIDGVSSELSASDAPGFNRLKVAVEEANSGKIHLELNNARSTSIGRLERSVRAEEGNVTGRGDAVSLRYANTDGSNDILGQYSIPVNARDGEINLGFQQSWTRLVSDEFEPLNISGSTLNVYLGFRQPILSRSTEEVSLGIQASRTQSETLRDGNLFPIRSDDGVDNRGRTRITGLQFYQEWLKRERRQLYSVRSEFGFGLDIGATEVAGQPDGRFFKWRGQGQWIRQLIGESQLFVNTDLQLSTTGLPQIEQFGLGGANFGRGYPSNLLVTDNGMNTSAEIRIPVLSVENRKGVLQIVPFLDYGMGWNLGGEDREVPGSNHLLSTGVGLQWQWSDRIFAQVSWGVPLINSVQQGGGLDQSQIYFKINSSIE